MAKKLIQAYRQAPWRKQLQSLGLYILPLIGIVITAAIHLMVGAQSAEAGLTIYSLRTKQEELQRIIANQRTQLAWLTSFQRMAAEAEKLGFVLIEEEQMHYVVLPAYSGRQTELLTPPPGAQDANTTIINAAYRKSLWDWALNTIFTAKQTVEEKSP